MRYIASFSLFVALLSISIGFSNCDLTKNVELELPSYDNLLVLECYLEPGKPYRALLTESVGYFSPPDFTFINDASITITYQGVKRTLGQDLIFDQTNERFFNYNSNVLVPEDYDNEFLIEVEAADGRTARATTKLLRPIPIDTLELEFRAEDSLAFLITRATDPVDEENFYRRMLHVGEDIVKGDLRQDFTVDDRFLGDSGELFFGTGFNFEKGDTIIASLLHIDKAYYDFLESVQDAVANNGNPFGQPGRIISNVDGGIGIFTGVSINRKTLIVE